MHNTYYSPTGNAEIWASKPSGYFTEAEWLAAHPTPKPESPTLEEACDIKLAELTIKTRATILAGFSHTLRGQAYHFGYDEEDQGNFSKANSAALLAVIQQDSSYRQVWRGWIDTKPHVFQLTVEEYLALSRAGADHQLWWQQRHWKKEAAIHAAESLEALDAIII